MATPEQRSRAARIAAHVQWARTPHRGERTAAARAASPVSIDYWLAKVTAEGKVRAKDIPAAAENAHKAYMGQLSLKASAARRRKTAERSVRRSA
ncbi:hypothetical protein ACFQ08_09110 [Streptosporangium algeriense]|uniref:Uncharacterized protein n=1 Tax=Streptosporangium algeriense TaxID=1682748 RepID=A0ABW3DPZ1_9ACTN